MRSAWRPPTGYQATQDNENAVLSAICSNMEPQGEQQVPFVPHAWSVVSVRLSTFLIFLFLRKIVFFGYIPRYSLKI